MRLSQVLLLVLLQIASTAQAQKRTMTPDDYKGWETITSRDITDDGRWLLYAVNVTDSDPYLVVKNNDDPREYKIPNGGGAEFSDDSKWCAYMISPPRDEIEKLQNDHRPVVRKLGLRNLDTGEERIFESVESFRFLKGGKTLLVQGTPADVRPAGPPEARPGATSEPPPPPASDLLVLSLSSGAVLPINGVVSARENHDGTDVAVVVRTSTGDQGLELLNPETLAIRPLQWGKEDFSDVAWANNGKALACLVGHKDESHQGDFNVLEEFTGLPSDPAKSVLDPNKKPWMPAGSRIGEGAVSLNDDGTAVAFGIGDWWPKAKPDEKAHPEIWNSNDLRTVPEQRVQAGRDRSRVDLAVWWPQTGSVQQITNGWEDSADLLKGFKLAVLSTETPYRKAVNNGWFYQDIYLVDTATGKRTRVLEKSHWGAEPSPDGKYLAYYKDRNWWVYDVASGASVEATVDARTGFENIEDDHTTPEKVPAGAPVWFAHDQGVIFPDFYDCWLATPPKAGGKWNLVRLTSGAKDHLVYRFVETQTDEDGPDMSKPMYFSILDKDTKETGFYTCDASGKGKQIAGDAARIGLLRKAKNADRVVFMMGSFDKSPNLYITNTTFSQVKPETKTNPQQAKFYWPKSELVEYKSRWGLPLQGILMYPANYDKTKRYPMVTLIYERLSDGLFNYIVPQDQNAYNQQILCQKGYFVFMPDIAYRGNDPGENAVACLEPAVAAVLAKNVGVDPSRVGLIGHSWGAYQTAFVTTVSHVFAVGCAGAPLTDLVSMYNTHYWNTGLPNAPILETSQGRLRVPFWEDPKAYIDNSPVWQSEKRKAPILITVGDQDGAVDYHQGIALYNTLRRMGKNCVLLVYYGENHNFTKRADQLDYGKRLRHFLDVYLQGAKPEPWISQGVPFIRREEE